MGAERRKQTKDVRPVQFKILGKAAHAILETVPRKKENKKMTIHKMSKTKTYRAWSDMKSRCYNEKVQAYKYYGARGIFVCSRWRDSFINFYQDLGECPPGYSIERINNDNGYYPENCKWIPLKAQGQNRRNARGIYHSDKAGSHITIKYKFECKRCGRKWESPVKDYRSCPKCRSYWWRIKKDSKYI
jgi:hypothetical protein